MIGNVVGNYKIERKLGEGGMGAVYQGIDLMLEREVAIKVLRPELASQPEVVERFRSEAVTLAKLHHPNIALLYSFFRQGDHFFMVLEFVRGETLDSIIASRGAMGCERALPLFCQVLDGIDHAHRYGIIHRDIKPANMMLTDEGSLKVLDFGIARILGTARMTKAGHLIGTIEYMSPEQVKGFETDARSDIYSLGMLLYEMLTGRTPFQIQNEFELMRAQVETMPVAPRAVNAEIPEAVEAAIMRAIAKNPAERFQTAGEFRQTLLSVGYGISTPFDSGGLRPDFSRMTRPISSYPGIHSNPPMSSPYAAPRETQPTAPPAPQSTDASFGAMTIADPQLQAVSAPTLITAEDATKKDDAPPNDSGKLKETRVGTANDLMQAKPAPQPTRLATGMDVSTTAAPIKAAETPNAAPNLASPQMPVSFLSRLTWKHYVGGAVAAMVAVGAVLIVGIAALLKSAGGAKTDNTKSATETTVKPIEPANTPVSAGQSEALQSITTPSLAPTQSASETETRTAQPAEIGAVKPDETSANTSPTTKPRQPPRESVSAASHQQPKPPRKENKPRDKGLDSLLNMH